MITGDTITHEELLALNAEHAAHDEEACPAGRAIHVRAMLRSAVALGVLSEGYPGSRADARACCAEILNGGDGLSEGYPGASADARAEILNKRNGQ